MFGQQSAGAINAGATLILLVHLFAASHGSESGNWFTKSLDYYGLEKCSPLDKSGVSGDLYGCLNKPVETPAAGNTAGQGESASSGNSWDSFIGSYGAGSSAGGSKGGQAGGFGSFGGFSAGQSSSPSTQTSGDSWPISLINEYQHLVDCFPSLIKPCMTETEVQFFNTIKNFFQAQIDFASPNASMMAERIAATGCVKSNSMDTSTVCYSTNLHKQNWFGWKINWIDGQMCNFLNDISTCEMASFDKCPADVISFVNGLWQAGLEATPCLSQMASTTEPGNGFTETTVSVTSTTLSPPAETVEQDSRVTTVAPLMQPGELSADPMGKVSLGSNKPSRNFNVTNINNEGQSNLQVTVQNLAISGGPGSEPEQKPEDHSGLVELLGKPDLDNQRVNQKDSRIHRLNQDNGRFGLGRGSNYQKPNDEDEDDPREMDTFKGKMGFKKLKRLHEVDGEGENRHGLERKHKNIREEQWSRVKEAFRRRMMESSASRESDESEYEEESDESDEDKLMDLFENHNDSKEKEKDRQHRRINPRFGGRLNLQRTRRNSKKEAADEERERKAEEMAELEEEEREQKEQKDEEEREKKEQEEEEEKEMKEQKEEEEKEKKEQEEEKKVENEKQKAEEVREKMDEEDEKRQQREEEEKEAFENEEEKRIEAEEAEKERLEEEKEQEQEEAEKFRKKSKKIKLGRGRRHSGRGEDDDRRKRRRDQEERQRREEEAQEKRQREEEERERLEEEEERRREEIERNREESQRERDQARQGTKRLEEAREMRERLVEEQQQRNREAEEEHRNIGEEVRHRQEEMASSVHRGAKRLQEEREQREEEERERLEEEEEEEKKLQRRRKQQSEDHDEREGRKRSESSRSIETNRNWAQRWSEETHGGNNGLNSRETSIKDCLESTNGNSWSSLSANHNADDVIELVCRNIDTIHSCLNQSAANGLSTRDRSTFNRLDHLAVTYQVLCEANNKPKEISTGQKVQQCLTATALDGQAGSSTSRLSSSQSLGSRRFH